MPEELDPNKEYPDPHPEEEAWEKAKKWVPSGGDVSAYRKDHMLNYHLGCPDCAHIKTHNRMVELRKGMEKLKKLTNDLVVDVRVSKMSGICRSCSTLRDIDGKCGCNDN